MMNRRYLFLAAVVVLVLALLVTTGDGCSALDGLPCPGAV